MPPQELRLADQRNRHLAAISKTFDEFLKEIRKLNENLEKIHATVQMKPV